MKTVVARGSAFEMGQMVGKAGILGFRYNCRERPPVSEETARLFARVAWAFTQSRYPAIAKEIEGISVGAEIPLDVLFLLYCEELWDSEEMNPSTGCTDIVARGKNSATGTTLLAHTNDSGAQFPGATSVTLIPNDGRPSSVGLGIDGYAPAVGRNARGIILTGNQLTSSDVRPGVPRLILARAVLDQFTLEEAVAVCLDPDRASSYNNILADSFGRVIDLEGSATRTSVVPFKDDLLIHTNHYLMPGMVGLEEKGDQSSTQNRLDVATELAHKFSPLTPSKLALILANHEGEPNCICRHGDDTRTFFATIYEAETGRCWVSDGPPCLQSWYCESPFPPE